jgi:hypothetical protein
MCPRQGSRVVILTVQQKCETTEAPITSAVDEPTVNNSSPLPAPSTQSTSEGVLTETNTRMRSLRPRKPEQLQAMKMHSIFDLSLPRQNSRSRASATGNAGSVSSSRRTNASAATVSTSVVLPTPTLEVGGTTCEDPIVVDFSPVKPSARPIRVVGTVRAARESGETNTAGSRIHDSIDCAPFPKDPHVNGAQTAFRSPPLALPRRVITMPSSSPTSQDPAATAYWGVTVDRLPSSMPQPSAPLGPNYAQREALLDEMLRSSEGHPAVERLVQHARATATPAEKFSSREEHMLWTDKWRPVRAEEVLGNKASALYLRDWLRALQLGQRPSEPAKDPVMDDLGKRKRRIKPAPSSSKPSITRTVVKRRGRKRLRLDSEEEDDGTGWIAMTSDEDTDAASAWTSEDELLLGPPSAPPSEASIDNVHPNRPATVVQDPVAHTFLDGLTNTILLSGPSGCGKSAAVYACAAELGYEVFEVYPGIGRRSGIQLETLIGDVGKNHLVNKVDTSRRSKGTNSSTNAEGFRALFGAPGVTVSRQPSLGVPHAADDATQAANKDEQSGSPPAEANAEHVEVRPPPAPESAQMIAQSIILLEEVDILFKDDAGFWPALVNIIKDCHRPVILTCNGLSAAFPSQTTRSLN